MVETFLPLIAVIMYSLDGCRDTYEKMVAVRLILDTAKSNK